MQPKTVQPKPFPDIKCIQHDSNVSLEGSLRGARKLQKRIHNETITLSNHLFASFHRLIISSSQHLIIAISSSHHVFTQYYKNAERGERSEPREAYAEQLSTSSSYLISRINVAYSVVEG